MFDINMYDLSDLPNKVTYCNWRTGMVFNDTGNYKFSHNHNIVNFISPRPPTFPIAAAVVYLFLLCSICLMMAYCHKFLHHQSFFVVYL